MLDLQKNNLNEYQIKIIQNYSKYTNYISLSDNNKSTNNVNIQMCMQEPHIKMGFSVNMSNMNQRHLSITSL